MDGAQKGATMDNDSIRRIVRAEKKRQHKTWRQISDLSGIGRSTVENYCTGGRNTSIVVIVGILKALGLELCVRRKKDETKDLRQVWGKN